MPVRFEEHDGKTRLVLSVVPRGQPGDFGLVIGKGDTPEQARMQALKVLGQNLTDLGTLVPLRRMNMNSDGLKSFGDIDQVQPPVPRYRSHKEVRALKILEVTFFGGGGDVGLFFDKKWGSITVNGDWVKAHLGFGEKMVDERRREGFNFGYYVIYKDGYTSWSPTQAFEEGYTEIFPDGTDTVVDPDGTVRGEPIPNTNAMRRG